MAIHALLPLDVPDAERVTVRPPPTENRLGEGAEAGNKAARKAWMRTLHRTPPGVDHRDLERANGLAQIAKRNRIARDGAPRAGHWTERGSDNQAGRMHVALHSPDGDTLWAGSAKGGIWRRPVDSNSSAWTPVGDNLYGGAHHLLVLDGTGADLLIAATDGGLLHRSVDDGASWIEPNGLPWRWGIRRLIATGGGIFVLIQEANWEGWSLWRSQDDGVSFTRVRDLGDYWGDVWSPRTGSDDLYLLDDGDMLLSTNDGDDWTTVGTLAGSEGGELTGSEAGAPALYAVLDSDDEHALWRSPDAGASWTEKHDVTDYWGTLNASFLDADLFAWGGVEVHRTNNGGASFDVVNEWGEYYVDIETNLHADVPGIDVVLDDQGQEVWYIATDGGLYHSLDGLATVQNLSLDGLRVSQYYSTLTSSANPQHIAAGAQDQGYQVSYAVEEGLVQFDQILSGDYGHLTSGDGTHAFVYACYPNFVLAAIGEDSPEFAFIAFPDGESQAWLPPIIADPEDREAFFFAATHLYRYTRVADDEWTPQQWSNRNFGVGDGEYLSALAFSPLDADRAYAATNEGRLFHSDDNGTTWTPASSEGPQGHYFYGTAMVASAVDIDTVYVGGSGYDGPAVWRSTDGGDTWHNWGQGLPATLVYSLTEATGGEVFAGTETAAYQRAEDGDAWVDVTQADAPVTIYWSVEALPGSTVRFGTYGRGIWDYAFETPAPCVDGQDSDGDGYDCDVDCDDSDADVHPGAPEACDGIDVDCDPLSPDEDDGDGDGFFACEGDCDDTRRSVNPDADETCDGRDEDCNGLIDDDATDATVFHRDADGDGHGDAGEILRACDPPDGWVGSVDDCDDSDAAIHPDADEICGDGRDNDCVGGDLPCPGNGDGDGCEDCGSSMAGARGTWLLVLALIARRRRPPGVVGVAGPAPSNLRETSRFKPSGASAGP
jgi:hypothetical protein